MWGSGPSFAEKVRVDAAETTDASLNKKAVAAGSRVVVVDTNVLVKGLKISHLADVAVTVPEVWRAVFEFVILDWQRSCRAPAVTISWTWNTFSKQSLSNYSRNVFELASCFPWH